MREIKFRGKRVDNSEWVYGDLIHDCNKRPLINIAGYSHLGTGIQYQGLVIPNTVGQFIGLKDENKVDVYEGDIVRNRFHRILLCEWFKGGFWLNGMQHGADYNIHLVYDSIKIIGNIHDNPELLTKE